MKTRRLQIIVVVMAFLMAIFVVQAHIATAGQAAPSAAPTKAIVWNGQSQFAAGSMEHKSFERASQMITQMSGGRLVAKPHPAGSIAPPAKQFDAVDSGTLDYAIDPGNYWRDKWQVATLFDNEINGMSAIEQQLWYLSGGGLQLVRRMVEKYNVHMINAALTYPPEIFLSTTKPLRTVADIKGLKIRTAGDDGTIFTQMGASVVMIPAGEIYEAMKRGTIDAFQYMSPAADASIGFHEAVKYVYLSPVRQPCSTSMVLANKKRWAELPADLQAIVENAFLGEAWRYYGEVVQEDAKALEKYKARGAVVAPIPKEIADEVARRAEKMYAERAAKDPFYAEVLSSRHTFQKALRAMFERM